SDLIGHVELEDMATIVECSIPIRRPNDLAGMQLGGKFSGGEAKELLCLTSEIVTRATHCIDNAGRSALRAEGSHMPPAMSYSTLY
ncbi:hypothetical protein ABTM86_19740, partial [Acinetobacter baumannii]